MKISIEIERQLDDETIKKTSGSVAVTLDDMTFKQYVDFHLLIEEWPKWLKDWADLDREKQIEARAEWDDRQKADYLVEAVKIVFNFSEG